ncbi:hypothetical protein evm_002057 [Chilo suppressalis]|nr:hypothetical protein evm_002057 [Chilo suppressalis]
MLVLLQDKENFVALVCVQNLRSDCNFSEDHARWPSVSSSNCGHNSKPTRTKKFGVSFLCRTIRKWNALPAHVYNLKA